MSSLSFSCEWLSAGQDIAPLRETVGQLTIRMGGALRAYNP